MKNIWNKYNNNQKNLIFDFAEKYRQFISECKTERECVKEIICKAKQHGFVSLEEIMKKNSLKSGDKIYVNNMNKMVALFIIGEDDLEQGMNVIGSHIDSPRLDLKPNPLYENEGFAYFDTHYYGGIKNYQWLTIPLAIHGIIVKTDGTKIEINIGENETDPVIGITDLLPHLAGEQLKKEASHFVDPENLDVMVSSIGEPNIDKESIKKYLLQILKEQYNFTEEDFLSAEIEIVPAFKARDFGLDRSMIIGYGHDDRSGAYASVEAILNIENPKRTCACLLVDKEEIGSYGATGMQSTFFHNTVMELLNLTNDGSVVKLNRCFSNSKVLSSDVNAGYDPLYEEVMEKNNSSYLNRGIVFNKYTGSRGKAGGSDANAEYVARLRNLLENENLDYQITELGKVGKGGGGTIAYILANYNMEVIDCGISVLSMHAPYEVISKADLYESYQFYKAFFKNMNNSSN